MLVKQIYTPEVCNHCGQTSTYLMAVDRGATIIVKALAAAIRRKGVNSIHPEKEMLVNRLAWSYEEAVTNGVLPMTYVKNFSRVRFYGLIAMVKDQPGHWCLTRKGAQFLKGMSIPKFAVRSKSDRKTIGYWEPEKYSVKVYDFTRNDENWEGINFDISDNQVMMSVPSRQEALNF